MNALQIAKEMQDMKEMAVVLSNIGNVYSTLGDLDKALKIYTSSLKVMENVRFKFGIATLLSSIGNVYFKKGELKKALEYYKSSLEMSEKIDQKGIMSAVLNNIGSILYLMDKLDEAMDTYVRCLKLSNEIGDKHTSSYALMNLARIYIQKGQSNYALKLATRAKDMIKEVDKMGYVESLGVLAEVELLMKEDAQAMEHVEEAIKIASEIGAREGEIVTRRVMGMIYRERGNFRQAIIEFTKAIRFFKSTHNDMELARTYYEYGLMWLKRKENDKVKENIEKALKIYEKYDVRLWINRCNEILNSL